MIKSNTKAAMKAARKILDAESGKPDAEHPYPCPVCGAQGIEDYDDDADIVACTTCLTPRHNGGATVRVARDYEIDGVWYCDVGAEFEDKIKKAKVKPPKKSDEEEILSAVEIVEEP